VPDGSYVYGFTLASTGSGVSWRGVDGSLTSVVIEGDLAAIVSDVSGGCHAWSSAPDGEPDLSSLATRAHEHERVLERALEQGPVVPMRFGTLYPSHEAVRQVLRAHHPAIYAAITRLDGKAEWGLTVTWDGRQQNGAACGETASSEPIQAAGRAYLVRREAEKAAADRLAGQRKEVASELHRAVQVIALAGVVHPTWRAGRPDEKGVLLRASYLVDQTDRDEFEKVIVDALKSRADLGLVGELTGPWPPYNFSRLELQGAPA
jgi:hypothetical protein